MGASLTGGPRAVNVPAPAPLFPGVQQNYVQSLTGAGVPTASFGTISEAARTGLPTDIGPAFEALKTSMGRGVEEGRANVLESLGASGRRYGSTAATAVTDFETQTQKDFASILASMTANAQEAAAQRRMQAAGTGVQAAGELAGAFRPTAVVASGGGILPTALGGLSALDSLGLFGSGGLGGLLGIP